MKENYIAQLKTGLTAAFVNAEVNSNLAYKPEFIYNNSKRGQKVLSSIENELLKCDRFAISVAFITRDGVTPFLQTLKELEQKGIPGRIMTTDYLTFSDPIALDMIAGLKNIELRMYYTEEAGNGFHTKGYIFRKDEEYRFIIGSSNMTQSALTRNMEWNTRLISSKDGEMIQDVLREYEKLWNASCTVPYDDFIENYRRHYEENKLFQKLVRDQKRIAQKERILSIAAYKLQPNSMQVEFINKLKKFIEMGEDKALLISATGTGKTYASAFAMREMQYPRVLFVVHRNQIAKQAKASFERVFGSTIKTGLVSGAAGTDEDYDADYVFATVQTLSKIENLQRFPKDYFCCCIYDEAHHTSAGSYKRLMDYFTPEFTLGMTATPDKRDDYSAKYKNTDFVLYQKYTYEDACRLLNWEANEVPLNIGGYKYDKKTKTFPVFINYDKREDISDTTKYEDHFTSNHSLIAISKSGRSLQSEDVQNFLQCEERGIQVELFVRKNKDDSGSKEFYYLGHMLPSGNAREFMMPNTTKSAVKIEWILDQPVREDIYDYIVNA